MECSKKNCRREAVTKIQGTLLCEYHKNMSEKENILEEAKNKGILTQNIPNFSKFKKRNQD